MFVFVNGPIGIDPKFVCGHFSSLQWKLDRRFIHMPHLYHDLFTQTPSVALCHFLFLSVNKLFHLSQV